MRPGGERATLRILVVEDEALVAMELLGMLEDLGHQGEGPAPDLPSALAAADRGRPDLALVDIRLARGHSGLEVARAFFELDIPVMFVTGNCPLEQGRGIAIGCLHKPVTDASFSAFNHAQSTFHLY